MVRATHAPGDRLADRDTIVHEGVLVGPAQLPSAAEKERCRLLLDAYTQLFSLLVRALPCTTCQC